MGKLREIVRALFGWPDRERLAGAIASAWIELDHQVTVAGVPTLSEPWARAAYRYLLEAESCLARRDLQQGWGLVTSAQRSLLLNPRNESGVHYAAIALRHEVDKLTGWRAKAIKDLICDEKGEILQAPPNAKRVVHALALRDEEFHTTYFKVQLRRHHLVQLCILLWLSIALCLLLSFKKALPVPLGNFCLVAPVVLFGVLGAALSVAQGLMAADLSKNIPAQKIGAFVVWMRPGIGAAAALMALILVYPNKTIDVFGWKIDDTLTLFVMAFVAGYSERFIVGAIGQIAETKTDAK